MSLYCLMYRGSVAQSVEKHIVPQGMCFATKAKGFCSTVALFKFRKLILLRLSSSVGRAMD